MAGEDTDKENAPPREPLSAEDRARFNQFVTKGRELAAEGEVRKALELLQKALKLCYNEKLARRIEKMEAYLKDEDDEDDGEDGDEMVHVGEGFYLFKELYSNLYAHQRDGVVWMWRIFKQRKGGILGDDMGLGKTIQVIAFLSGMFDAEKIHTVLIILPVAVMINWEREFEKWAPGIRIENFHGGSKRERERTLNKIHKRGGVMMTSYGMLVNNADQLSERDGREYIWDSIILDEGHKIKNPSNKCSKGLQSIAARHRLILTGTPVQNNLKEMWALFDWTHQGSLLGTAKTFAMEFDGPISRARQKDATPGEERLGHEMANSLRKIIAPYFMRRTKAQVTKDKLAETKRQAEEGDDEPVGLKAKDMPTLKRKNDLIIWAYMSEVQQKIYRDFAESDEVQQLLNTSKSPLTALMVLKKICDHPRLLTTRQCHILGLKMNEDFDEGAESSDQCAANRIDHISNEQLVRESGKMVFLLDLIDNLKAEGHRCLVFSQSKKVLDILQKVLRDKGHKVARIDGTINLNEREDVIDRFSKNESYSVFLLTTQVGGVGLTITAADRVVIYDPSWNPATDAQAVDRAFRIGQTRDVVVYRIITCGSIEEKIYRRQIFKDSITKQTTGESNNPYKYFSRQELFELFTLDNPRVSTTQQQLAEIHRGRRITDTSLDAHIAFLHSTDIYGISDHDLMFTKEAAQLEDEEAGTEYVQQRVQRAHQLLTLECEENVQMAEQLGKYPGAEAARPARPHGGGGGVQNWQWPQAETASHEAERSLVDLTKIRENGEDSDESSSESEDSDGQDLQDEVQKLDLNEYETPMMPKWTGKEEVVMSTDTPVGARADKPILLADTPVRGDPSPQNNGRRTIIDDSLSTSFTENNAAQHETSLQVVEDSGDETASMVVESFEDEEDSSSESFHTPGDRKGSSHDDDDSGTNKRESPFTPDTKASAKKRRRSCAWTPGRGGRLGRPVSPNAADNSDMEDVVAEELVFSPTKYEPLAHTETSRHTTMSISAADIPENDEDFMERLKAKDNCNSTTVYDRGMRDKLSSLEMVSEGEEESSSRHSSGGLTVPRAAKPISRHGTPGALPGRTPQGTPRTVINDSDYESPIVTGMTKKKTAVVESDDEDSFQGENSAHNQSPGAADRVSTTDENSDSEVEGGNYEMSASWDADIDEAGADESEVAAAASHTEDDQLKEEEGGEEEVEEEEEEEEEEDEEEEEEEEEDEEEEEEEDEEELTEEQQAKYLQLMTESRKLYKQGDHVGALGHCVDALDIYSGDERANHYAMKLQQKLKLQKELSQS